MRDERGQSVVELVAMTPVFLLCCLLALQALAAGATFVSADNAAHAGAVAGELGGNPRAAARAALPGWATGRVSVRSVGGRVDVQLRPRAIVPPLQNLLGVRSTAWFVK